MPGHLRDAPPGQCLGINIYHWCTNTFWCYHCMPSMNDQDRTCKNIGAMQIKEAYEGITECGKILDEDTCSANPNCFYCGHDIIPCLAKQHSDLCHKTLTSLDGPIPFLILAMGALIL